MASNNKVRAASGGAVVLIGGGVFIFSGLWMTVLFLVGIGAMSTFIISGKNYRTDRLLGS